MTIGAAYKLCRLMMVSYSLVMLRTVAAILAWSVCATMPFAAVADFKAGLIAFEKGDYVTAYKEWMPEAEIGSKGAQYNLGILFHKGYGVKQSNTEAYYWYLRAAAQGLAEAQYNVAVMNEGKEIPNASDSIALEFYEKSAAQEYAPAQYNLGHVYLHGTLGLSRKRYTAKIWFERAAMQGNLEAQYMAAYVNQIYDKPQAWGWVRLAEERGHPTAKELREIFEQHFADAFIKKGEAFYELLRKKIRVAE